MRAWTLLLLHFLRPWAPSSGGASPPAPFPVVHISSVLPAVPKAWCHHFVCLCSSLQFPLLPLFHFSHMPSSIDFSLWAGFVPTSPLLISRSRCTLPAGHSPSTYRGCLRVPISLCITMAHIFLTTSLWGYHVPNPQTKSACVDALLQGVNILLIALWSVGCYQPGLSHRQDAAFFCTSCHLQREFWFCGGFLTNALRSYSTTAQRLLREEPVNRAGSLVRSADQKAQDPEQPQQWPRMKSARE